MMSLFFIVAIVNHKFKVADVVDVVIIAHAVNIVNIVDVVDVCRSVHVVCC